MRRLLLPVFALPLLVGCELFQAAKSGDTGPAEDTAREPIDRDTGEDREDPNAYEGDDEGECSDGLDNDLDGDRDCDDAGCADSPDCFGADDTGSGSGPGGDGGGPGDDTGSGPGGGPGGDGGDGGDGGGPGGDDTGPPEGSHGFDWGWLIDVGSTGPEIYYVFLQGETYVVPGSSYSGGHWLSIYDEDLATTLCSWKYSTVTASPATACGLCDFAFDTQSSNASEVGGSSCDDFELDLTSWGITLGYQGDSVYSYWGVGTGTFWYEYAGSWYRNYYTFAYYY